MCQMPFRRVKCKGIEGKDRKLKELGGKERVLRGMKELERIES